MTLTMFWVITWLITFIRHFRLGYDISDRWNIYRPFALTLAFSVLDVILGIIWVISILIYISKLIFR